MAASVRPSNNRTSAHSRAHSGDLPIGSRKNVIVKIRRVNFDGSVDLRLEGLPNGVTGTRTLLKAGSTAVEVPITASYGIEPSDTEIRIVATAKNLSVDKAIRLKVIPDKKPPDR